MLTTLTIHEIERDLQATLPSLFTRGATYLRNNSGRTPWLAALMIGAMIVGYAYQMVPLDEAFVSCVFALMTLFHHARTKRAERAALSAAEQSAQLAPVLTLLSDLQTQVAALTESLAVATRQKGESPPHTTPLPH